MIRLLHTVTPRVWSSTLRLATNRPFASVTVAVTLISSTPLRKRNPGGSVCCPSSVAATAHEDGTATITWQTDEPSSSEVQYGTSPDTLTDSKSDPTRVSDHRVESLRPLRNVHVSSHHVDQIRALH